MVTRKKAGVASVAPTWYLTVDGVVVPLVPSVEAILLIEASTGKTISQHLFASAARAITIVDLGLIARCLAGPDAPIEGLQAPPFAYNAVITLQLRGERAEDIVVRTGPIDVMACLMPPLLAAAQGKIDAAGNRTAE